MLLEQEKRERNMKKLVKMNNTQKCKTVLLQVEVILAAKILMRSSPNLLEVCRKEEDDRQNQNIQF